MSSRAERRSASAAWRAILLAALLCVLAAFAPRAEAEALEPPPDWAPLVEEARLALSRPGIETAELSLLRERLLRMRSAAIDFETTAMADVAEVSARIASLGPPPSDGTTEGPEIAERRSRLAGELSAAQVPVIAAQDVRREADSLVRQIDRIIVERFTAELTARGPSPLQPGLWLETVGAVDANVAIWLKKVRATFADKAARDAILRGLPLDLALAAIGIALAFGIRHQLGEKIDEGLRAARSTWAVALLVFLRNVARLIMPAVGAGLLYAALDPRTFVDPAAERTLFNLPRFLLVLIGASWLGASLFAPRLAAYRIAPVNDAEAAWGARTILALGFVLSAALLLRRYTDDWALTPGETATLAFPVFVIGGVVLWRTARSIRAIRRGIAARDGGTGPGERAGTITFAALMLLQRGCWLLAFLVPALAAIGYLALANYLMFGVILTIGLIGAGLVLYDLLVAIVGAMVSRDGHRSAAFASGLVPVVIGALLTVAALPPLALIWGARVSDLTDLWFLLRDGVTFGGMRVSLSTIFSFALVFGIVFGLTRVLQSVLRTTVLPRTRMDAGGKNAVLSGVGYVGFIFGVVAAVSSTGLDLTSLAFVAGALSVGIGFGLQNIVSNFVSGIILLVERPIKEGDWIEVGGQMGYVRNISVRSTVIETFDRASVILPNSDLVAGTVLNRTHTGMTGRLTVPVGVSYASDPRHVERVLTEIAEEHPMVLNEPAPRVIFMGFGPDSLDFEIRCWLRDVNFSLSARSDMNFAILERFTEEGISIPFPQRVVEIKNPAALVAAATEGRDPSDRGGSPSAASDPEDAADARRESRRIAGQS